MQLDPSEDKKEPMQLDQPKDKEDPMQADPGRRIEMN